MKNYHYALGMIMAVGMLAAMPASAAVPSNLDQYGCRAEKANEYKCYQGNLAGQTFKSQNEMLSKTSTKPMGSSGTSTDSPSAPSSANSPSGSASPGSTGGASESPSPAPKY